MKVKRINEFSSKIKGNTRIDAKKLIKSMRGKYGEKYIQLFETICDEMEDKSLGRNSLIDKLEIHSRNDDGESAFDIFIHPTLQSRVEAKYRGRDIDEMLDFFNIRVNPLDKEPVTLYLHTENEVLGPADIENIDEYSYVDVLKCISRDYWDEEDAAIDAED